MAALEQATFGTGCFWCTEAVFQQLKGVENVVSGYSGGKIPNPTYEEICTGTTQHAECVQVSFDPSIIRYEDLLTAFWYSHDPTTLNRQGNDIGTQYRSVIYYHNELQRELALASKTKMTENQVFDKPIVTEISPLGIFYPAEDYHQNYYNIVGNRNPYCSFIITPKISKLRQQLRDSGLLRT